MAEATPKAGMLMFAILYVPGRHWAAGRTIAQQDLQAHRDYLAEFAERGSVESAGPFTDNSGGMVILHAANQLEADQFIAADPGVVNGVFKANARQWHVAFRKNTGMPALDHRRHQ